MSATRLDPGTRSWRRPFGRALASVVGIAICVACVGGLRAEDPRPDDAGMGSYLLGSIQYVRWPAEESIAAWQVCRPGTANKAAHNMELSRRRAEAVAQEFIGYGFLDASIQRTAWSFEHPVAPNDTAEGRALNRRVAIVVVAGAH